jgi:hypothetical protein
VFVRRRIEEKAVNMFGTNEQQLRNGVYDGRIGTMKNDDFNQDGPEADLSEKSGSETERRVLEGHPEGPLCQRCGGQVRGRRRNGYCSDRCRMADRREQERRRRLALLDTISAAVAQLRNE